MEVLNRRTLDGDDVVLVRKPTNKKGKQYEYTVRLDGVNSTVADDRKLYNRKDAEAYFMETVGQIKRGMRKEKERNQRGGFGFGLGGGGQTQDSGGGPPGFGLGLGGTGKEKEDRDDGPRFPWM